MATVLPLTRSIRIAGREHIVALPGRFDVHAVEPVVARFTQEDAGTIALDGSLVEHIDRAGLDALRLISQLAEARGQRVSITNASLGLRLAVELTDTPGLPPLRHDDLLVDLEAA